MRQTPFVTLLWLAPPLRAQSPATMSRKATRSAATVEM
jgi:hypothetical protein